MRTTIVLGIYAGLLTAFVALAGPALADHNEDCGAPNTIELGRVDVNTWTPSGGCRGASVALEGFLCADGHDVRLTGTIHVQVLSDVGCETGVQVAQLQ